MQKSEGFGNIDAEALQNMASLYNSSTGVLKVNNLEASGNITTSGNVTATGYGEFGNAYIGKWKTTSSDWAAFSHKDNKTGKGDYALVQSDDGQTLINSSTDKKVQILNNDTSKSRVEFLNGNVTATGYGEFGNAYIGPLKTTDPETTDPETTDPEKIDPDSDWAAFSHKAKKNIINDYALVQNAPGRTIVNSAKDKPVEVRTNDSDGSAATFKVYGSVEVHGACEKDVHKRSDPNSFQPAPIKLMNDTCHWDDHTDNVAIGGEALVQTFVTS